MFNITDAEMPELVEEYEIFMNHVAVLEKIDTDGKAPLAYPYEIETCFLRDDEPIDVISREDVLKMLRVFKIIKLKYQRWWDNESLFN